MGLKQGFLTSEVESYPDMRTQKQPCSPPGDPKIGTQYKRWRSENESLLQGFVSIATNSILG